MHVPVIIDEQTSHTTANEGIRWNKKIIIITTVKNNPMVKLFYFIFFTSMYFVRFMSS